MKIGIDGSRAFIKNRTGIEEYAYRVIEDLRENLSGHEVVLYLRHYQNVDFELPSNWSVKKIRCPRLWTQIGLSFELLVNKVDALFVPAHTVPIIHPKKTVVVIHGLEYEFCIDSYSSWQRNYMRKIIRWSCSWASDVICVSNNTKSDLMNLYSVPKEKISVIYEGYNRRFQLPEFCEDEVIEKDETIDSDNLGISEFGAYFLFIGRLEKRKNVANIVRAFDYVKNKYGTKHKLVLAGRPGYGYEDVKKEILKSDHTAEIIELGFVSEKEKWALFSCASAFVFPTLYEGFGIPILEAQSAMVPVIASNNSSIPEVAGRGAILVEPQNISDIGENMYIAVSDEKAREELVRNGYENIKKFSWAQCAREIGGVIKERSE